MHFGASHRNQNVYNLEKGIVNIIQGVQEDDVYFIFQYWLRSVFQYGHKGGKYTDTQCLERCLEQY